MFARQIVSLNTFQNSLSRTVYSAFSFVFLTIIIFSTSFANADGTTDAKSYGPVKNGQTLWDIAKENQSDKSISVEQLVYAIYELNPDAFQSGNMNLLKKGSYLTLPDAEAVQKISATQAKKQLLQHVHALELFRADAQQLKAAKITAKKHHKQTRALQKQLARYRHKSYAWNQVYKKYVKSKRREIKSKKAISKLSALLLEKATMKSSQLARIEHPKSDMSEVKNRLVQIQSSLESLNASNNKLVDQVQQLATLDERVKILEDELGKNDELVMQLKNTLDAAQEAIKQQQLDSKNLEQRLQELQAKNDTAENTTKNSATPVIPAEVTEAQAEEVHEPEPEAVVETVYDPIANNAIEDNTIEPVVETVKEDTVESAPVEIAVPDTAGHNTTKNSAEDLNITNGNNSLVVDDSPADNSDKTVAIIGAENSSPIQTTTAKNNPTPVTPTKVTESQAKELNEPEREAVVETVTDIQAEEVIVESEPEVAVETVFDATANTVTEQGAFETAADSIKDVTVESASNEVAKTETAGVIETAETEKDETIEISTEKNTGTVSTNQKINAEENSNNDRLGDISSGRNTDEENPVIEGADVVTPTTPMLNENHPADTFDTYLASLYMEDSNALLVEKDLDSNSENIPMAIKSSFKPRDVEAEPITRTEKYTSTPEDQVNGRNAEEQTIPEKIAADQQLGMLNQNSLTANHENSLLALFKSKLFIIASILNGLILIYVIYSFFSRKQMLAEIEDTNADSDNPKQYISWQDREKPKRASFKE